MPIKSIQMMNVLNPNTLSDKKMKCKVRASQTWGLELSSQHPRKRPGLAPHAWDPMLCCRQEDQWCLRPSSDSGSQRNTGRMVPDISSGLLRGVATWTHMCTYTTLIETDRQTDRKEKTWGTWLGVWVSMCLPALSSRKQKGFKLRLRPVWSV